MAVKRRKHSSRRYEQGSADRLTWTKYFLFLIECFVFSYFRLIKHLFVLKSKMPRSNVIIDLFATGAILYVFSIFHWWFVMGGMVGFLVFIAHIGHLRRKHLQNKLLKNQQVSFREEYLKELPAMPTPESIGQGNPATYKNPTKVIPMKPVVEPKAKKAKAQKDAGNLPNFADDDMTAWHKWFAENPDKVRAHKSN